MLPHGNLGRNSKKDAFIFTNLRPHFEGSFRVTLLQKTSPAEEPLFWRKVVTHLSQKGAPRIVLLTATGNFPFFIKTTDFWILFQAHGADIVRRAAYKKTADPSKRTRKTDMIRTETYFFLCFHFLDFEPVRGKGVFISDWSKCVEELLFRALFKPLVSVQLHEDLMLLHMCNHLFVSAFLYSMYIQLNFLFSGLTLSGHILFLVATAVLNVAGYNILPITFDRVSRI